MIPRSVLYKRLCAGQSHACWYNSVLKTVLQVLPQIGNRIHRLIFKFTPMLRIMMSRLCIAFPQGQVIFITGLFRNARQERLVIAASL